MPAVLHIFLWGFVVAAALAASCHAVIYKRESRSAALWFLVSWLLPIVGPALYFLLGINQVRREATALRGQMVRHRTQPPMIPCEDEGTQLPREAYHLYPLAQLGCRVMDRQLVPGNAISPLMDGSEAYPAMLQAIERAKVSIGLATYIFDASGIGEKFIQALVAAQERGVKVRILIDAVGVKYCRPNILKVLRDRGLNAAVFNPPWMYPWIGALNLRNHRKILVADGAMGFTGGFNIKREYWAEDHASAPFRDLHFGVGGPVVAHLSEVFADDWQFTTGEALRGEIWFPKIEPIRGGAPARGIEAGPDENYDRLRWVIIGAINGARKLIRIATPYYLPDAAIISALNAAALRGVRVDILLPRTSNLPWLNWAVFGQLWQTLDRGCNVFMSDGAFDHSKFFVVDTAWALIGSANWDNRSLRLNFEFNLESYDPALAFRLDQFFDTRLLEARPLTREDLDARPFPVKLRDGFARLFTPYL